MHKKIIMFFMIQVCTQVSAMEPIDETLIPQTDHMQSNNEQPDQGQSDHEQPNLPIEEKPAFFVRPYKVGWKLTTRLVESHQRKNLPLFLAKEAIQENDSVKLTILLNAGVFDFTPQENELTSVSFALLKCAIKARNPDMVELLLKAKANPNATSIEEDEGNNILSVACRRAFLPRMHQNVYEICKLLLAHGAQINKRCIVEAEEERGYLLPLFVRHILTQPNGNDRPNFYIKNTFEGRSPIYLENVNQLLALIEAHERPDAFGGLHPSTLSNKPFFVYGLLGLFESETSHLYFQSEFFGSDREKQIQEEQMIETIKRSIELPE